MRVPAPVALLAAGARRRHPAGGLADVEQPGWQHRAAAPHGRPTCSSGNGYTDLVARRSLGQGDAGLQPQALCERCPSACCRDFDGRHSDSIYHPFDKAGNRHTEYVNQHGAFDDMPLDRIVADFEIRHPLVICNPPFRSAAEMNGASFDADVAKETEA